MAEQTGRTVVAAFKHRAQAQRAVDALLDAGFDETAIALETSEQWHQEQRSAAEASDAYAPAPRGEARAAGEAGPHAETGGSDGSFLDEGPLAAAGAFAADRLAAFADPAAPARWPVPAGAALGGALAAAAVQIARRRRGWWRRRGWSAGEVAIVAAGAVAGALAGLARLSDWRRVTEPVADEQPDGVEYDEGSLERGHTVVAVAPGGRLLDAEQLLRAFGGRGVHLRAAGETADVEATVRMDTIA
jgi:hypothetical protein